MPVILSKAKATALIIIFVLTASGCSMLFGGDPEETTEDFAFQTGGELPEEVSDWVDEIRDSGEPGTDWMRHNDHVYVAVARGEVPNPGYGVVIDGMSYTHERDGRVTVGVRARYTKPEEGQSYVQVISYPVAVARFNVDVLPTSQLADVHFSFIVDDSVGDPVADQPGTTTHTMVLFFATQDGWLQREIRTLRWNVEVGELSPALVGQEIMSGPGSDHLVSILPEGTTLHVNVDEDDPSLAYANFSEEITGVGGSLGEMLAVHGVVNALLENDLGITRVQILVDGEVTESLGHLDLSEPLVFDESMIRESK